MNQKSVKTESAYLPRELVVKKVCALTESERLFTLSAARGRLGEASPGQFFMIGLPGYGEAPFSFASTQKPSGRIEFCIRAVGNLTRALHRLEPGERVWVRGPYGNGFPTNEFKGRDILFIAGGLGIIPMRALIMKVLSKRSDFGALTLLYGIREPGSLLFADEMKDWKKKGLECRLTLDRPHPDWRGRTGVVTTLLPELEVRQRNTVAAVIGPPVMYKYVVLGLEEIKVKAPDIFVSLERRMKCGIGKCGHCQINSVYCCQEGPVFRLSDIAGLREATS